MRLSAAITSLCAAEKPYLVPTFLLINTYRANRDQSIALMSAPTYYRHRMELANYFHVRI